MKSYKKSKKTGIMITALLALSIFSIEILADVDNAIKRSCKAEYYASITSFSYEHPSGRKMINIPYGEMMVAVRGGYEFMTYSTGNRLKKNEIRKRARNKLIECAWSSAKIPDLWRCNTIRAYPTKLREELVTVLREHVCKRPLYYFTLDNLNPGNIDMTTLFPTNYTAEFILGVKTWGDKGCGSKSPGKFTTLDGERYQRKRGSNARHLFTPLKKFTVTCP